MSARWRSPPDAEDLERLAPDAYAGQWLGKHGRLHIAYSDDPAGHVAEAQARLGLSCKVVVVRHRRSLRTLRKVSDEAADPAWWRRYGSELYVVGVDEEDNVVDVGVDPLTDAALAAAADRFGDSIRVREDRVEPC